MDQDLSKVIDKLRKLVKHQESAAAIGSEAEAQAFAEKIAEMCDRYRLSVAELGEEAIKNTIRTAHWEPETIGQKTKYVRPRCFLVLTSAIAAGYHCVQTSNGFINHCNFIGLEEDVATCIAMTGILVRAMDECFRKRSLVASQKFKRSEYYYGFALAIAWRYQQRRKEQEQGDGSEQALMLLTDRLVRQAVESIPTSNIREKKIEMSASLAAGYRDGSKQDLNARLLNSNESQSPLRQLTA